MNNLDMNICIVLEMDYKKTYQLPKDWDEIDIHTKCELLGKALTNNKRIEDLEEYKKIGE